jgi:glutaminyl-tRNA synthetase
MPTLRAMRRRGYTAEAIREFIRRVGVAKNYSVSDVSLLEACVRDDLNKTSLRRMAVIRPLKVVIDNYPDDLVEEMDAVNNPEDPNAGARKVPFSRMISARHHRQNIIASSPAMKFVCAMHISLSAPTWSRMTRAK